jgi:hypothetical protein
MSKQAMAGLWLWEDWVEELGLEVCVYFWRGWEEVAVGR